MDRFKDLIGVDKYRGYLNYYYGVTVEEALQLAVELEVMKQYTSNGLHYKDEASEVAFRRIYRLSREELLADFREETGLSMRRSIDMAEWRQFTYWLFKYRVKNCDKARIAQRYAQGPGPAREDAERSRGELLAASRRGRALRGRRGTRGPVEVELGGLSGNGSQSCCAGERWPRIGYGAGPSTG